MKNHSSQSVHTAEAAKKALYIKAGLVIFAILIAASIFAVVQIAAIAKDLPDPQKSGNWRMTQSTKLYDRTGTILLYEINSSGKRTVVPYDQIPDTTKKATIAIEDQDFYTHSAIDIKGIFRSFTVNILRGGFSQGGSTITQQLAKNAFLSREKTITRKVKEIILAFWIEKYYSKDQILNLYLNQIPYGAGANGIEAASQTYFGKSARDLSLNESATLAALLQIPSYYSPWGPHKDDLLKRKDLTLENMNKLGYITKDQLDANLHISPHFLAQSLGSIKAPHFVMSVRDYLINKYGEDTVDSGGLQVITTLDYGMQQIAEQVVRDGAARNAELYKGNNAALVAEDPKTGQILALVGSADYFNQAIEGNFNVASQGLRQPGSSFKPFAYMTAFQKGYPSDTILFDLPTEFDTGSGSYKPENYDHQFRGPISLRNSLAQSINVTAVKTLYLAGIDDTIKNATTFGITTLGDPKRYGLSLVLGGGEVKLVDMVGAYSVFAQDGVKHQQVSVLSVKDESGSILEQYSDHSEQVIDAQYPRMINDILSDSEARRPLFQNSFDQTVFPDRQVALKTGTTNDYRDAWVMGYTPSLVVGVWAGNHHQEPMQKSAGSILAAVPIWHDFMTQALPSMPAETFTKPEPVTSQKPMLNGQYNTGGEIHTILYYVDRSNPTGSAPSNPSQDPQFNQWEGPVRAWAIQNR